MPEGPGRYDALTTWVREMTDAAGVILIVLPREGGKAGMSVQATSREIVRSVPSVLRQVADEIEREP